MKYLITENQFTNTIKKLVLSAFNEIKNICEYPDAETFPTWLGFEDCEVANLIEKIEISEIQKEKSIPDIYGKKYPRFIVWINVYHHTRSHIYDLDLIGLAIGVVMFQKYKIKAMFRVQEEIYTNTNPNW